MTRRIHWNLPRPWLAPLVPFYAAAISLRSAGLRFGLEPIQPLGWPVVSVGSLSAGGAGKTPFAIALTHLLREAGLAVDVLSRGYGRRTHRAMRVDPAGTAADFGDEPILIARDAGVPVFVGARRIDSGRLAEADNIPGIHLLDDGFQHRQLARDVDIALLSSDDLNDWLLPAGNLREPLSALRRADVLAVEAGDDAALRRLDALTLGQAASQQVWRFRRIMQIPSLDDPAGPVLAFCGIARPLQFFAGLRVAGLNVAAQHAFPDHHHFQPTDLHLLRTLARQTGATSMITTPKDSVRLAGLQFDLPLHTAGLRIKLADESEALAWLQKSLRDPLSRSRIHSSFGM